MRTVILLLVIGPCLQAALAGQQPTSTKPALTQAALLDRVIDVDRLADPPPAGERSLLFSSYDRREREVRNKRYIHWDADNDAGQFIQTTGDGWNVMAEVSDPGAIEHIWCDKPTGKVRIELDGKPVIETDFAGLFDGSTAPFGEPLSYFISQDKRGANLYFPIGFAKNCRVLSRGFAGRYQIDVTAFAPETNVATFTPELDQPARDALDRVVTAMRMGLSDKVIYGHRKLMTDAIQQELARDEKFVETFDKPGTIRSLMVSVTDRGRPRELYAMHKCIIRIFWDGHTDPDIELPLSSFFGSGFDRNPYNSLVMGTNRWLDLPGLFPNESDFMYCLFPMPFAKARIEIENRNRTKIGLMLYIRVERAAPAPDRLRFRAHFHKEDPCKTFDYPLLETTGPGRIVGCVLNIDTPRDDWWGRGDHKVWIDGGAFPAMPGTGTADYFGNVAGLIKSERPLHGVTRVSPHGKNSLYRWHLADAIVFHKQVRFTIENWQPDNANDVYYSSIAYWYGPPDAHETGDRLTEADLTLEGLRIPGSVEIEGHIRGDQHLTQLKQKYAGRVELSGRRAVNFPADKPIEVDLPSEKTGTYRLSVRVLPTRSFKKITIARPDGTVVGTVEYARHRDGIYTVGTIDLVAGDNPLVVTCTHSTTLDCWIIEPVTQQAKPRP